MNALAPLACAALLLAGQAAAQPASERRFQVSGFDGVDLAGCDHAIVIPGRAFGITVRGTQRSLSATQIERRGTTLRIRPLHDRCSSAHGPASAATITITMPVVRRLTVSGASSIEARDVSGRKLVATASGAGSLELPALRVEEAQLSLSGGGQATVSGARVDRLALHVSGGGSTAADGTTRALAIGADGAARVDTRKLVAPIVSISARGASVVQASASGPAAINARGASSVSVGGHPACTIDAQRPAKVTCG